MPLRSALLALFAALPLIAPPAAVCDPDVHVPLIPRDVLFGNPERASVRLSHDGQHISFLAPDEGVLNVWIARVDAPDAPTPLTKDRGRGVRSYFWAYDNEHVLYLQDTGGDENYQLFATSIKTGETRELTSNEPITDENGLPLTDPSTGSALRPRVRVEHLSFRSPESIVVGLNNRDPRYHDLHSINITTGEGTLVLQNDGFSGFTFDLDGNVRLASRAKSDGGTEVLRRVDSGWEPYLEIGLEDVLTTRVVGFDRSGRVLHTLDSTGRDTAALIATDVVTGESREIASNERADISGVMLHPRSLAVQASSSTYLRRVWTVHDDDISEDFSYLRSIADGDISVLSRSLDDELWAVAYLRDNGPTEYYLYSRSNKRATRLFSSRPALEGLPLARMHAGVIQSRDGLGLPTYHSLPVWTDPSESGRPEQPLSTVLLVHGGPWARDNWGFNALHQWLTNRGHAVVSVNFRGSTGFGKSFLNAGNLQWAGKMHDDLIDTVDWAIAEGIADPDRVAIMGGSYGGYAALTGLTFTPDRFAAGVSIVGPSNLVTLMDSIPAYWTSFRDQLRKRVGDIDTPEGRIMLRSRSPLTHVDEIKRPLLIGQGANDPRVKQAESDQIVDAMNQRGIPVTYALFPDEGHGFARPENRLAFYAIAEAFLAQHLGGAYEEIGDDIEGSSLDVPTGAEYVPGLGGMIED